WRAGSRLDFCQHYWSLWAVFCALIIRVQARTEAPSARSNSSIRDRVGVDDFVPVAGSIRLTEPCGDFPPGGFDGGEEGSPEGEVGRGRCGEGAAGSVQGLRVP